MFNAELPIFVVAVRDEFVTPADGLETTVSAFGTREEAESFARSVAEQESEPASLYRIVEYTFSGNVTEV